MNGLELENNKLNNSKTSINVVAVCMLDSIHTARWLKQFKNEGINFYLFPSTPSRSIHKDILNLSASNFEAKSSYRIYLGKNLVPIILWFLDLFLRNSLRGFLISRVCRKVNADFLHAIELNHAGYLVFASHKFSLPNGLKIISTNWGSDIFWFQKFEKHRKKIMELLSITDIYSAECKRDLELASDLGFKNTFRPVVPNAGGFELSLINNNRVPPSERNLIVVKGYESFAGKFSIALKAISDSSELIRNYKVIVYSANKKSIILAKKAAKQTGLDIVCYPKKSLSHHELMGIFAQARVYLGVSLSDGISTSMLEAMVTGVFPIQTSTSCANEWIKNGISGFLVAPNVSEVKNAVKEAVTNDYLVDSAAEINNKTANERLSKEIIFNKVKYFYQN